jgi:Ca2+/Na+ antiporter
MNLKNEIVEPVVGVDILKPSVQYESRICPFKYVSIVIRGSVFAAYCNSVHKIHSSIAASLVQTSKASVSRHFLSITLV